MRTRLARGTVLGLALLTLLSFVPAAASIADDLVVLKGSARDQLVAGGLERKQMRSLESLQKKILRVEETDPVEETSKYLLRAAKVVQQVGKVEAAGVDLGDGAAPLIASLADEVEAHEVAAQKTRDALLVEKDEKVVDRMLVRARAQVDAAKGQTTDAKRAKKLARAAKTFLKAEARGRKLLDKEIGKGLVRFEIVQTSLDGDPVLLPEETIEVEFTLPPEIDSLAPSNVYISERSPGNPEGPGETFPVIAEPGDTPTTVRLRPDVPPPPGTWFLVISGMDSENQDGVRSADYPVALETTLVIEITVPGE